MTPASATASIPRAALMFAGVVTAIVVLVMLVDLGARERIAQSAAELTAARMAEVLPGGTYDSSLAGDVLTQELALFDADAPLPVHRYWRVGKPAAAILQVTVPDGYNGDIVLLVGVTADQRISGVRVISHRETPGLGDDIELRRSDWIKSFDTLSLSVLSEADWAVRRRGGQFDAFTGATITPQAVIRGVYRSLRWFEQHATTVFEQPRTPSS